MAKGGSSGSLTSTMDKDIYNLIYDLLDERTAENKRKLLHQSGIDSNNVDIDMPDPLEYMETANNITVPQVFAYMKQKRHALARKKESLITKNVRNILETIRKEEESELGKVDPNDEDDEIAGEVEVIDVDEIDEEDGDDDNLMEVKDSNMLNKSVVSLWNNNNINPSETPEPSTETTATSKKRSSSKDSKSTSKRQKKKPDYSPPTSDFSSLGGLENIITQLYELIGLPILHPELYEATGVEPPRGVLLYGPPGCGKTSIAHSLAGQLQVPFINISAPSIVSGMSGESEKKLRELFDEAKALAPCLIFMDEIDSITPKRDGGAQREMERRIVAQLLTLMDELTLDKTGGKPVIVIGATNRPDSLDSALRRAGRFDREICLNVPNEQQRISILKTMTKNIKLDDRDGFNYRELSKLTPGYVGADLQSLVTAAGIAAIKRIFESLSEQQIEQPEQVVPTADSMDIDSELIHKFQTKSDEEKLSTIKRFLTLHPNPLTQAQLSPLSITYADFLVALPTIQPTAKREGFATVPDVTWQNVGALSKIRMELHMCIVQPIKKPELYKKVGISAPAGVLMWGPPGCGKTLLAKAVANELRANFISIKGPELLNKYVGESERAVRQVFSRARASVPCIIFFDELDALVPNRDANNSEASSRVVNTLLTELDGLNDRNGIFVIGATNRPDMIDRAMLRPGRLDKTLYIELPDAGEREEILKTLIKANRSPVASDVDLGKIANAEKCRNFSGADLSSLVREAGVSALKKKFFKGQEVKQLDVSGFYEKTDDGEEEGGDDDNDVEITMDDFEIALKNIKPSVTDRDRLKYEELNRDMGWKDPKEEEEDEE